MVESTHGETAVSYQHASLRYICHLRNRCRGIFRPYLHQLVTEGISRRHSEMYHIRHIRNTAQRSETPICTYLLSLSLLSPCSVCNAEQAFFLAIFSFCYDRIHGGLKALTRVRRLAVPVQQHTHIRTCNAKLGGYLVIGDLMNVHLAHKLASPGFQQNYTSLVLICLTAAEKSAILPISPLRQIQRRWPFDQTFELARSRPWGHGVMRLGSKRNRNRESERRQQEAQLHMRISWQNRREPVQRSTLNYAARHC